MINRQDKNVARKKRHLRVRKSVEGNAARPRLNIFRSQKHIYAQIIDDGNGSTLVAASSLDMSDDGKKSHGNKEAARQVGELIGRKAIEKGISEVVFDRGGYLYHGRVKELAEGARKSGLKF
jgi:large subunit ribosomal protein L18